MCAIKYVEEEGREEELVVLAVSSKRGSRTWPLSPT
jgi:hypothetical protein